MRKTLLTSLFVCGAVAAAIGGINGADNFVRKAQQKGVAYEADAELARNRAELQSRLKPQAADVLYAPEYDWTDTDTVPYFVIARLATVNGYTYVHEGGDIEIYDMGVAHKGSQVFLTNLANAHDPSNTWSPVHEFAVEGVYDEGAGTITIANPTTCAADSYSTYDLVYGKFDERGNFEAGGDFVLNTDKDLTTISAKKDFGLQYEYSWSPGSYGWGKRFHEIKAVKKDSSTPADLVVLAESIDFGLTYPGVKQEQTWRVINAGGTDAEYVIKIDSDDDAYECEEMSGVIEAYSDKVITFEFNPQSVGEFEGLATLQTEECDPVLVQFAGECVAVPDYSGIVKNGDFRFETGIDFPFEMADFNHPIYDDKGNDTGETEKIRVAKTSTNGVYGASYLKAHFNVPEGKVGKLTFKGHVINSDAMYWYRVSSSILVDDDNAYVAQYHNTGDFKPEDTTFEFTPGDHYLYIHHLNDYYTGMEKDGTYIWDLDLQLIEAKDDAAELMTEEVKFPNSLLDKDAVVKKEAQIVLLNKGMNSLEVKAVESDNDEFKAEIPARTAGQLEELVVPVFLETSTTGVKEANIKLSTSAGEFTAKVVANVIERPDYMQIISGATEIVTIEYNEEFPFIIENGKAYNITSKVPDTEVTYSSFRISYTVPEGKIAQFSWDGHCWGTPEEEYYKGIQDSDYGGVIAANPSGNGLMGAMFDNDKDYSSKYLEEGSSAAYTIASAGSGYFEFYYHQGGDNRYFGEDRLEISNFNIKLIDSEEDAAEVLTPEVEFEPVYVGPQRYSTATVKVRNLGTNVLKVNEIPNVGPFYGIEPSSSELPCKFYDTMSITLWFYPQEEGAFEDDLIIKTTAGDLKVHCKGETLATPEGLIYNGDFEDAAYGWETYDANNDGEAWNLATNLWGERPTYVHSGVEALCSVSQSMNLGAITPDNWTVSPVIAIPENGAKLTYYVAAFSPDAYEEHYSFYVTDNYKDLSSFDALDPIIEETIEVPATQDEKNGFVDGWVLREVDLSAFAGRKIWLAFRHHDCKGQYILRLDDVMVYESDGSGIADLTHGIVSQEYFDVNGMRINELQNGVNIVRTTLENGKTITSKVIYRK